MEHSLISMMEKLILPKLYYLQTKEPYTLNTNHLQDNGQLILSLTILLFNHMDIFMILIINAQIILKPFSPLLLKVNKYFFFTAHLMETAFKDGRLKAQSWLKNNLSQ